jgi:hypothetical protein
MRIGIDVSQIVYEGTGVARYVRELTREVIVKDKKNSYILFGISLRKRHVIDAFIAECKNLNSKIVGISYPIPIRIFELLWNRIGIVPIEWLIGKVDVFWSSDWIQPPLASAKGLTTIHDLTVLRFPESFDQQIVSVHKRKLLRSKKICSFFFADSEATATDARTLLGIPNEKISVVYPGYKREYV